jgi:hypothetical protein
MARPRSIPVNARSFETLATDGATLRFPAPLAERGTNSAGFEFWWKMLDFVFELADPATFPPLPTPPAGRDAAILTRYTSAAEDMAESALLSADERFTVHIPDDDDKEGVERIETYFASNEVTRGFTTLFRQFDANKEPAGFSQVQRALRRADELAADEPSNERLSQLKVWGKACSRLHADSLKVLVGKKLRDQGRWPGKIPGETGPSPTRLISAYQYGDLIHWGDHAEFLAIARDPFEQAYQRMAFLEAVVGLTHVYLGFSVLVKAAPAR